MTAATINAVQAAELVRRSMAIADRAVVADIETEGFSVKDDAGLLWYDVRPMQDPNECAPTTIDMVTECLAYAHQRGLIRTHPQHQHLVRPTHLDRR